MKAISKNVLFFCFFAQLGVSLLGNQWWCICTYDQIFADLDKCYRLKKTDPCFPNVLEQITKELLKYASASHPWWRCLIGIDGKVIYKWCGGDYPKKPGLYMHWGSRDCGDVVKMVRDAIFPFINNYRLINMESKIDKLGGSISNMVEAGNKATIVIDTLKSEKTMIQAELTKTRTSIASLESKLTDLEKKYHEELLKKLDEISALLQKMMLPVDLMSPGANKNSLNSCQ